LQKIGAGNFKLKPNCRKEIVKERINDRVFTYRLEDIFDGKVDFVVRLALACSPYLR